MPSCNAFLQGLFGCNSEDQSRQGVKFFMKPRNECPFSARTHTVLEELGISYETIEVPTKPAPEWYIRQINAKGKVPAIQMPHLDNKVIYESAICNEYLVDVYGTDSSSLVLLMPTDPIQRADIRLLNDSCDEFGKRAFEVILNKDEEKTAEVIKRMEDVLTTYEQQLDKSGGPFLMGKTFTLADAHLYPFFVRLFAPLKEFKSYQPPVGKFPRVLDYCKACADRDSFKVSSSISHEEMCNTVKKLLNL